MSSHLAESWVPGWILIYLNYYSRLRFHKVIETHNTLQSNSSLPSLNDTRVSQCNLVIISVA